MAWTFTLSSVIVSSSVANPSVITTATPHGFASGDSVDITGHTSVTPDINGTHTITVVSSTTFSIPVNVTDGGVGGRVSGPVVIRYESLEIQENANNLPTFACKIQSILGTFRPQVGAEIVAYESGTPRFGGLITTPSEHGLGRVASTAIETDVSAAGFATYLLRRYINDVRPEETVEDRLDFIVTTYFAAYGITVDAGQATGILLPAKTYTWVLGPDFMNDLALEAGGPTGPPWQWKVDALKAISVFDPVAVAAAFDVVTNDGNALGDIEVEPTTDDQRANRAIILVEGAESMFVTDVFTAGGGATESYATAYPVSQEQEGHPNLLVVNGTVEDTISWYPEQGMGIAWRWDHANNQLVHAGGGFVPANGDTITVRYPVAFPFPVIRNNLADQAINGIIEVKINVDQSWTIAQAEAYGDAIVAKVSSTPKVVSYKTKQFIQPGESQTINVPERGVNGTYTVVDVITRNDIGNAVNRFVTAVEDGINQGGPRETVKAWMGGGGGSGGVSVSGGGATNPHPPMRSVQSFGDDGKFFGHASVVVDHDNTGPLYGTVGGGLRARLAIRGNGLNQAALALYDDTGGIAKGSWIAVDGAGDVHIDLFNDINWRVTRRCDWTIGTGGRFRVAPSSPLANFINLRGVVEMYGLSPNSARLTGNTTIDATTPQTVFHCDASSAAFTVTFPALAAASINTSTDHYRLLLLKNIGTANAVTLDANSSEVFWNGVQSSLTLTLYPGQWCLLAARTGTGAGWHVFASNLNDLLIYETVHDDATIKAYPTTVASIVPAFGANSRIMFDRVDMRADFSSGAYTNVNAAASLWLQYITSNAVASNYLANIAAPARTYLSAVFTNATKRVAPFFPWEDTIETNQWGNLVVPMLQSNTANQGLEAAMDNVGSGNLTGGHANNTVTWRTYFRLENAA